MIADMDHIHMDAPVGNPSDNPMPSSPDGFWRTNGLDTLQIDDEEVRAMHGLDEYDPVDAYERGVVTRPKTEKPQTPITNDGFLAEIFGRIFELAHPLVCRKSGDPDAGGWTAVRWPTDTSDQNKTGMPCRVFTSRMRLADSERRNN